MDLMQRDETGRQRLEAHDRRKKSRQELAEKKVKRSVQDAPVTESDVAVRDAVGAPGTPWATGHRRQLIQSWKYQRIRLSGSR